jgi:ADP-dependent phosphofructokinase/glucokinase
MGIGLAKLKEQSLFIDLNYHSMNDYLEKLCDDMNIERSTAHNWLYIGEAYVKYRRELERIEFSDADGPTKLPYVDRALELYKKREVFKNIKGMSLRAFMEYSRGKKAAAPLSKIRVAGNKVFIGKKLTVTFADELDHKTRKYLTDINVQVGEALQAGEVLYATRLYDMEELRRFERGAEKMKKEMRVKDRRN